MRRRPSPLSDDAYKASTNKARHLASYNTERNGDPYGIRTRVAAVKGRCPRPLDEGVVRSVG